MTTAHSAQLLVCMGSGGVGKTTTAAALALRAAQEGRKVCVVTIDPAKRLADALGVRGELSNEPSLVSNFGDGELWAMMLDARQTFVDLIALTSTSAEQAERIHNNALFSSIARQLGGTQEYMAAEKLFQLHRDDRFDLVIVDTPPSREALNFLGAPNTLVRFLDHRVYRTFLAPARGGLKIVSAALTPIFKARRSRRHHRRHRLLCGLRRTRSRLPRSCRVDQRRTPRSFDDLRRRHLSRSRTDARSNVHHRGAETPEHLAQRGDL
jgi:anion-transporting  ArsA/GET3 family ATPase